ncbi:MAG: hypothetical protein GX628_09865 [Clostridiales bacterium]|nr:hypothetical protein [Clostridiales bacterium]
MKKENQVGLFYFLWLGEHGRHRPYDISKITAEHPDAGYHPEAEYWGSVGTYHHWGEPLFGYYYSNDEWVVRRHMKLLIHAGIDFLFFDTTNAVMYEENARLVMRVLQEYHDHGHRIPQVMFYTNTASGDTAERIYRAIYREGYCPDTWYIIDGRPAIIAFPDECSDEVRDFFTIKLPQWPNEPDKVGGWPWMDFTRPQRVFIGLDGKPECINVSAAQHPQIRFGDSVLYGETTNRGRAYHNGANDPAPGAWKTPYNLIEQFERALEADVPYTLVTGWNEWIAGRWQGPPERPIVFVDCCNYEYSRDIEMMRGGYSDNYYLALCEYTARLKGRKYPGETLLLDGDSAVFKGFHDGGMSRKHEGYGGHIYENHTPRHAITALEVHRGGGRLSLTVLTADAIDLSVSDTGGEFLRIYITAGENTYVTNAPIESENGISCLSDICGNVLYRAPFTLFAPNRLTVNIPESVIGADPGIRISLKAYDSREVHTSHEDFYDKGDTLPPGRDGINLILK